MKNLILFLLSVTVSLVSLSQSPATNIVYGAPVVITSRTNDTTSVYLRTSTKNIVGITWNAGNGKIEYRLPQDSVIISNDSLFYKNSSGYKYLVAKLSGNGGLETDPVFMASAAHNITSGNINAWNNVYNWYNSNGWLNFTPSSFIHVNATISINGNTQFLTNNPSFTITAGTGSSASFNFDSALATKTTNNLTEGSINKYYTDARARAAFSIAKLPLSYNSVTGVLDFDTAHWHSKAFYDGIYQQVGNYLTSVTGINAGGDLFGTYPNPSVVGIRGSSIPSLSSGYLHYNGSAFVWDAPASGSSSFASLSDVALTSLANNQLVHYNSSTSKWENFTAPYLSSYTETDQLALKIANNLADLPSVPTARTNLGLGSLATLSSINNSNWSGAALADANIASSANWNTAYNKYIASGSYSAGTLTLTRNDASTLSISGFTTSSGGSGSGWLLTGNTGITTSNFIGTIDANEFNIRTKNTLAVKLDTLQRIFFSGNAKVNSSSDARLVVSRTNTSSYARLGLQTNDVDQWFIDMRSDETVANTMFWENASGTKIFAALQNGNVGIADNNPSYKLSVGGSIHSVSDATIDGNVILTSSTNKSITLNASGSTSYDRLLFFTGGALKWELGKRGDEPSADLFQFNNASAQNVLSLQQSTRYVGVNTLSPTSTLDVNGTAKANGFARRSTSVTTSSTLTNNYSVWFVNSSSATTQVLPSASSVTDFEITIRNNNSGTVTVSGVVTGDPNTSIASGVAVTYHTDGSSWYSISKN